MFRNIYFKIVLIIPFFLLNFPKISAHCDSMEGPVVKASIKALETGNINYVLIWVKQEYETEINKLFEKVQSVRKLSNEAKELADNYFFETLVRLHRTGEGESYNGIKPVGYKPEPGIEAADLAIENNSIDSVLANLNENEHLKVKELFNDLQVKKNYDKNDINSGRKYVASYVHFIHYIEELYSGKAEHHLH